MGYPLSRRLERLSSERWARRSLRTLLRSAWLGMSLLCIGLGMQLLLDWQIPLEILGAVALGCVAIGAILLLRRRMPAREVARRLDHRFDLHEQLATALEISSRGDPQGVELRLLEQASTTTGHVQKYVARNKRQPWIELVTLFTLALLGLGMFLLLNLDAMSSQPTAEPLPDLNDPAAMQNQQDQPQSQSQSDEGADGSGGEQPGANQNTQSQVAQGMGYDQQSAETLADALRDQSVTRPAAESLDQGDVEGAAQNLRELADQADQLSDDTRRDLAQELRQAANEILPNNPEFAEQVRESAYGMQQSGQSTAEALENLADAVEQLDSSQQPGQQQAQEGQQQNQQDQQASGGGSVGNAPPDEQREQAESSERLGVDGVPLELESQGDGGGGSGDDESQTTATGGGGFVDQADTPDDTTVRIGDDPLRIPADLRDVVQEYFSPTE